MKNKLYILVDNTLNPIYGAVQGGHAVAQWISDYGLKEWNNDYLIYLSVDINKWKDYLIYKRHSYFLEPDLDNQLTSIAVLEKDLDNILKHLIKKEKLL